MLLHHGLFVLLSSAAVAACEKAYPSEGAGFISESRPNLCRIASSYASFNGTKDDSPAIQAAFAQCAKNSVILFSEGVD